MEGLEELAAQIREQNELYESGDTDKAFWLGQRNRLKAMREIEPGLSQREMGEMVGKSHTWVRTLLNMETAVSNPFSREENRSKLGTAPARKVLSENPQAVAKEIAEAMEKPEVRKAVAKHSTPSTLGGMRDTAEEEQFSRRRRPSGTPARELTGTGESPTEVSEEMQARAMDQPINSIHAAAVKAKARKDREGFHLLPDADIEEARRQLVETGQIVAELGEGLDGFENEVNENKGAAR